MAKNNLTDRQCATAKVASGETLLGDGDRLYLRVRPESKQWLYIYSDPIGRKRKVALGPYPTFGLAAAREWAAEQNRLLATGTMPGEAKRLAKESAKAAAIKTTAALLEAYCDHLAHRGQVSARQVKAQLAIHIPQALLAIPAAQVKSSDITPVIRRLVGAEKLRTAGKIRSYLHSAFEMALTAEDTPEAPAAALGFGLSANPVARVKVPVGGKGQPRDRVLTQDEARMWFRWLLEQSPEPRRDLVLYQMLTCGQRLRQLVEATIADGQLVILDAKGARSTPRKHLVPVIGRMAELTKGKPRLFPQMLPAEVNTLGTAANDMTGRFLAEHPEMSHFAPSDIRRTAETALASLGWSESDRSQLLSHGIGGIQAKHYDRHNYDDVKRRMLADWLEWMGGVK